ncbi:hypothetical protein [Metapseudomonas otitidis]|uniref:hypothetical protein n=1 Tax=Metapseudomonas otitidis TaxID=319939 RepID=UPI0013E007AB|nr:hypothetical protein [Pseudomonas otitidis]
MTDEYTEAKFHGLKINCGKHKPTNIRIIELIYIMTFISIENFKRPTGYHIRTRLSSKMNATEFSARLITHYKRKSGYSPLRVSVLEDDPLQGGRHYHHALILDARYDTHLSLNYFLSKLQKSGLLHDYYIQNHNDAPYGLKLDNEHSKAKYIEWTSYLAKTKTKATNTQTYSASRAISKDLASWKKSGSPTLNRVNEPQSLEHFLTTPKINNHNINHLSHIS